MCDHKIEGEKFLILKMNATMRQMRQYPSKP